MLRRFSFFTLLSLAACGDDNPPADAGSTPDSGRSKQLDCPEVFECVERCRDGDDVCVDACVDRSTRQAAPDVDDLLACAQSNDCDDEVCLAQNCEDEVLACAGAEAFDGGVPAGGSELDCSEVFDCVDACREGDDTCIAACIARGTSAAQAVVDDVLSCAQTNACDDETCLERRCKAELLACADATPLDGGAPDSGSRADAGADTGTPPDAGPSCEHAGKPELTGPISGLMASYAPGDPIKISVPVDQDTARVIVGIYEIGSVLYLGGTAEDVAASSTATLDFFAGVKGGETGTFYLSVELCSTSVCTTPFVRNTYQRADRSAPRTAGETYAQTRENVGGPAATEICASSIPVQTFAIQ